MFGICTPDDDQFNAQRMGAGRPPPPARPMATKPLPAVSSAQLEQLVRRTHPGMSFSDIQLEVERLEQLHAAPAQPVLHVQGEAELAQLIARESKCTPAEAQRRARVAVENIRAVRAARAVRGAR
jgi:hypothetical protein